MKYEDALIYASGIVILTVCNAILVSKYYVSAFHNGMKIRVAVCSLVYRKVCIGYQCNCCRCAFNSLNISGPTAIAYSTWRNCSRKSGELVIERCSTP